MKSLNSIIIIDLKKNKSKNHSLIYKKEFEILIDILFDDEELIDLQIVTIDSSLFLVVITNKRLILSKKLSSWNKKIVQCGLEQLIDIKVNVINNNNSSCVLIFENDQFIKLENIQLVVLKEFTNKIFNTRNEYINGS
ncbi:hypothetical protein [Mycoplasma sp. HU2014]|uniref:hypothetical protein n=1 Tax=Mycoplasma sp. HU2014 TaxID=1664275 RepID=UPI00067C84E6|nr:hypothetical protein [Mycoplasma sp. HU2014]KNG79040.1 hypothetical protein AB668_04670 [Mycoplasma sp. HU2014]